MHNLLKFLLSVAAFLEAKYFSSFGEPINSGHSSRVRFEQLRKDITNAQAPYDFERCRRDIERYKSDFGCAAYDDYLKLNTLLYRKHTSVKRRENDLYKNLQTA